MPVCACCKKFKPVLKSRTMQICHACAAYNDPFNDDIWKNDHQGLWRIRALHPFLLKVNLYLRRRGIKLPWLHLG